MADTGVAVGTIVALGSAPALAGAIEWAVERRAPTRAWAMATALACAGVAMLALAGADASISLPGVVLALVAGASYAGYTLAAKRMLHDGPRARDGDGGRVRPRRRRAAARCSSITGAGWLATPGGAALALFLGDRPDRRRLPAVRPRPASRLSAAETATLTLAEPLTAALLGVIVLSERMSRARGARRGADPRRPARAGRARRPPPPATVPA